MTNNQNKVLSIIYLLLFLAILVFGFYWWTTRKEFEEVKQIDNTNFALIDSLKKISGENTYLKTQIQTSSKEFLKLQFDHLSSLQKIHDLLSKDPEIKEVIVTKTNTLTDTFFQTVVKYKDVLIRDSVYRKKVFYKQWSDKWSNGEVSASEDSIYFRHKINNEYHISQKYEKINGKLNPVVYWKNINPYSSVDSIYSFTVKQPNFKRFSVVTGLGAGISGDFKIKPHIGILVGYKLFEF